MLTDTIITLFIGAALGYALRSARGQEPIVHRPYRNLYNDASAAREDHLG